MLSTAKKKKKKEREREREGGKEMGILLTIRHFVSLSVLTLHINCSTFNPVYCIDIIMGEEINSWLL